MNGELIFLVQGNAPNPFRVCFRREGEGLSATCTCNAGALGKLCKHRLGLMKGDPFGLVGGSSAQVALIQELGLGSAALNVGISRSGTGGVRLTAARGDPLCSMFGAPTRKFGPTMWSGVSPSRPRSPASTRGP